MKPKPIKIITVYLLHFYCEGSKARHYLGSTEWHRLPERMKRHQFGTGAAFTRRMVENGSRFALARIWCPATRDLEKKIKTRSHYRAICPICSPSAREYLYLDQAKKTCQFEAFAGLGGSSRSNWQAQAWQPATPKLKTKGRRTEPLVPTATGD